MGRFSGAVRSVMHQLEHGLGGFLALAGGLTLAIGGIVGNYSINSQNAHWLESGTMTEAVVVRTACPVNTVPRCVWLQFAVAENEVHVMLDSRTPNLEGVDVAIGAKVPIAYSREDPRDVWVLRSDSDSKKWMSKVPIGLVLCSFGTVMVASWYRHRRARGTDDAQADRRGGRASDLR